MRAARLAAAAAALKRQSGDNAAPFSLAFLTDRRRIAAPEPILRALPKGAAVILRDYDAPRRAAMAARLGAICKARGLVFIVGGDPQLAIECGADGVHYRADMLKDARAPAGLFATAACHTADDLQRAREAGCAAVFLSPVFATLSHAGAPPLGARRFRALAARAGLPVLALGGVDAAKAASLAGPHVAGLGAIGAFSPAH